MSIIIIPAYNPDDKLIKIVKDIKQFKIYEIVVVNDGSVEESIFNKINNEVILLSHDKNYGKGVAIKTALQYIKQKNINDKILIMDADGQHKIQDGIKLLNELDINKKEIIIGKRNFKEKIPLKSKVGNVIAKYLFRIFCGQCIYDTQTGLRAFNSNIIDMLIDIKGDRFEYEINMLIQCAKKKIKIKELDIETIYEKGNSSSHYRVILDSLKIGSAFITSKLYLFLLFLVILSFSLIFFSRSNHDNPNISNNMFDVKLISSNSVTQGNVIVYKFENNGDLKSDIVAEILNSAGTVVANATIKEDKILIDTSILPAGTYKVRIIYNSFEMIISEYFKVVLIKI